MTIHASYKPPVGVVSKQSSPSAPDASATVASSVANNDLSGSSAQTVLDPVREWAPSGLPVIKHIPKSARPACASHFAAVLRAIVAKPTDNTNWLSLFNWGVSVLQPPKRGGKRHNLTSNIKRRISEFSPGAVLTPSNEFSASRKSTPPDTLLAQAVSSKLEDGNIRAAIRLMCSDD